MKNQIIFLPLRVMRCSLLLILVLLYFPLFSQQSIKGKVMDEKAIPLKDVSVSVDGSKPVLTSSNGIFTISDKKSEKPKFVESKKQGLIIKDWEWTETNKELTVTMSPVKIIRGKVISDRGVPVVGINVLVLGLRNSAPVKTNKNGEFSIDVPRDLIINEENIAIFDPGRLKGKANYDLLFSEDGSIYLKVDIDPRQVRKVNVLSQENEPVKDAEVFIDDKPFLTDNNGFIEIPANVRVNDFSTFSIRKVYLEKLEYVDVGSTMMMYVTVPKEGETIKEREATTTFEIEKAANILELFILQEKQGNRQKRAEEIRARLAENISDEERVRLTAELLRINNELKDINKGLEIVTGNQAKLLKEFEDRFRKKEKELRDAVEKSVKDEQMRKNAAERLYYIIFFISMAMAALAAIITLILINNRRIRKQKNELAEKVEEINLKNIMLEESAQVMDIKNREIRVKNEQLTEKTGELEEINNKLTDSIRYASTIQQSILPNHNFLDNYIKDHFIFFEPRDIVSGDFYWFSKKANELVIIAADCTGHGVPGAFMTMMGNTLLNQIVNENNTTDPAEILNQLNAQVVATLKLEDQDSQTKRDGDGMDVALLNIDLVSKKVTFAGAKNPLYYIRDNELYYLKGSNIAIGSTLGKQGKVFENHTFNLKGNEIFYLVSDGFQDQLGVEEKLPGQLKRRKYMKTHFMDLLLECSKLPMNEQYIKLKHEFLNWKKDMDQTDDVLIIGIQI